MSEYGLKETNDVVKLAMKMALLIVEVKKENGKFSDYLEKLKNSPEKEEAFENLGDVVREIMDLRMDDIPEGIKLAISDYKWFLDEVKKLK